MTHKTIVSLWTRSETSDHKFLSSQEYFNKLLVKCDHKIKEMIVEYHKIPDENTPKIATYQHEKEQISEIKPQNVL